MVKSVAAMLLLIGGLIAFAAQTAPAVQVCVIPSATLTGIGGVNSTICTPSLVAHGGSTSQRPCLHAPPRAHACAGVIVRVP